VNKLSIIDYISNYLISTSPASIYVRLAGSELLNIVARTNKVRPIKLVTTRTSGAVK